MERNCINKVIAFLIEYRDTRAWSIDIEKYLTSLLTSIELKNKVKELKALGYTSNDIKKLVG